MKHPNQATLALHAGGDLGFFRQWLVGSHVRRCKDCSAEIAAFDELRQVLPGLNEIPEVPWNRLAADMRANIRLGLAAGECVRPDEVPLRQTRLFTGVRAAIAMASILVLLATGIVLERPMPKPVEEGLSVQTTANGIQLRDGTRSLSLYNTGSGTTYVPDAEGGMRAVSVNDAGSVTITRVSYAE
jgi:hypothetical protein